MNNELNFMSPTPGAISSGLMVLKAGQPHFTDAGLFAIAGTIAHAREGESHEHCLHGFLRALKVARAAGLDQQAESAILWAFAENISPGDDNPEGTALAALCRLVATLVGVGRMAHLIEGKKAH